MENGLCGCGCGGTPLLTTRSNKAKGILVGQHHRFIKGHHSRRVVLSIPYRLVETSDGRKVSLHRWRAEKALGKRLPKGAVVHHADGTTGDNSPLVICQDASYHKLLHRRMRVKAAGGNPNTDRICSKCRTVKSMELFGVNALNPDGLNYACKACCAVAAQRFRDTGSTRVAS